MTNFPEEPQTVEELFALCDNFPEHAHLYRPSDADCLGMGIDPERLREPEPLPDLVLRQLYAAAEHNPEFIKLLQRNFVGGGK